VPPPPGAAYAAVVLRIVGWVAVILGALLVVVPGRLGRRWSNLLAAVAAGPFLLVLVAYVAVGSTEFVVPPRIHEQDPGLPATLSARAILVSPVLHTFATLGLTALALILLWQVLEGARGIRDVGISAGTVAARLGGVVVVALAVKLVWIAFGYLGWLPGWLGGASDVWAHSRADGLLSWVLAVVFSGAVCWWLAVHRRPSGPSLPDHQITTPAWYVVAGFLAVAVAADLVRMVLAIVGRFSEGASAVLRSIIDWLDIHSGWSPVVTVCLAAAAGLLLAWRGGLRGRAVFLLVFAAWALLRATLIVPNLLTPEFQTEEAWAPLLEERGQGPGWVDPVTLDTTLTVGLALLVVRGRRGVQFKVDAATLAMVLLAATLVAHSATLVPNAWKAGFPYYLLLLFPVAYRFLFDAGALNVRDERRATRVLVALGTTAVTLALTGFLLSNGGFRPGETSPAEPGRTLLLVPLTALLVGAATAARAEAVEAGETPPDVRREAPGGGGAA